MMPETAHELVARGAELLDAKLPGWANVIDIETLAMESECRCVLGQLGEARYNLYALTWHGRRPPKQVQFIDMTDALGLEGADPDDTCLSCACGFDGTCTCVTYDALQDAWKGEIVARRTL